MHILNPIVSKIHYKEIEVVNEVGTCATITKDDFTWDVELRNHNLFINGKIGSISVLPNSVDKIVLS